MNESRPEVRSTMRLVLAVAAGILVIVALGIIWRHRAQRRHDREIIAALLAAARRGQDEVPCGVHVEKVVEVAQQAKALPVPTCARPITTAGKQVARKDAPEWQDLVEKYDRVARGYEAIADAVAAFDVRTATAVSSATAGVSDIIDPELRRNAEEARAALERREQVTASFVADWRTSSRATSSYARRVEAGLLHGDGDACAALPQREAAAAARIMARFPHDELILVPKWR